MSAVINSSVKYVGVDDHVIDLFEGQFSVPEGMSYNSYVIVDEKIAVMDSVDQNFGNKWIENIKKVLGDRIPDYLVVHHMEMDHSANILKFAETFPKSVIVSSKMAFAMMKSYFGSDFDGRNLVVGEGDSLELGAHTLNFITASNVHWPEVIMSYESSDKILFSADAFGKFGALDTEDNDWVCEARRYYFGIVGKFGANVQNLLKKFSGKAISFICPLHGPVLSSDIDTYLSLYDTWSAYKPESDGVVIAYTSVYGNTKKVAAKLKQILEEKGVAKVVLTDLARSDVYENVEDAFRYNRIIFASTTYCGGVFPTMRVFIEHLVSRGWQNRFVGFVENGSWLPMAAKTMKDLLSGCKSLKFAENLVSIKIVPSNADYKKLEDLADEVASVNF